jgi:hypothetical protein
VNDEMKRFLARQPFVKNGFWIVVILIILQLFQTPQFAEFLESFRVMLANFGVDWSAEAMASVLDFLVKGGSLVAVFFGIYQTWKEVTPVSDPRNDAGEALVAESVVASRVAARVAERLQDVPTQPQSDE